MGVLRGFDSLFPLFLDFRLFYFFQPHQQYTQAANTLFFIFFSIFFVFFREVKMKSVFAASLMAASVLGGAVELTMDTFETEVIASGKAGFIKFLAPW